MELSDMLISQFVKATNDDSGIRGETTAYGTIVVHDDAQYVVLDGSIYETPVVSTTDVNEGDRVLVRLKNHTAMVTDNLTNPSIGIKRAGELESRITQTAEEIRLEVTNKTSGIESKITQTASDIRSEITSGIDGLRTEIKQTTDSISATVKGNNDAFTEFKQTVEGFSFMGKGGTVKIAGGDITLTGAIKFTDFETSVQNTVNAASNNATTALATAITASEKANTAQNTADDARDTANTAYYNAGQAMVNAESAAQAAAIAQAMASSIQLPSYLKSTYIDSTTIMSPSIVGGTFYAVGQSAWTTMSSDGLRVYTGGISTPKIELLNYNRFVEMILGAGDENGLGRFLISKDVDNTVLKYESPDSYFIFNAIVFAKDGSIVVRRGLADGTTISKTLI